MKRRIFSALILSLVFAFAGNSQEILSLKECYELAELSSSLAAEKESYSRISELKDKNLSKGWLPSIDANGTFVYNSEVVDMSSALGSLPIPGIANAIQPLPNEQYKINLEINQVIYDGGFIKNSRNLEKTDQSINQKQTETDLYKLRSQINAYYFNLMLADKQKELLDNYNLLISRRLSSMESALENGFILRSDVDVLSTEKLRIDQQLAELEIKKSSLLKVLSDLTGRKIDNSAKFILPEIKKDLSSEILRPELEIFDLRKEQAEGGLRLIESKRKPKAFGFATLGYGNPPGNNFFKDEFAPYYIVGAGIKWNILDWSKSKNEKQVINYQLDILENRKEDLTDNLRRLLETKNAEILSYSSLISTDSVLISLRKKITASAESQYENGTITATELLNVMNSEQQALINYEIHRINHALARVEYMNISGQEIE